MAKGSESTGAWQMWLLAEETRRYPLSLMVGVLFGLAFPTPGIAGLAWLVPGLLWVSCGGLSLGSAFRVGWVAGCVGFLISLRWLLNIPFASGAVAAWLSLSLYCGLSLGLWTLGLAWAWNRFADSIPGDRKSVV